MVRSGRTGAALATSAGVAGVVLAVFQIVQSTVSDFEPRTTVKILIGLTIFAFGLVVGRLRVLAGRRQARNDRDRELDEDLAVWPLETLAEVDAYYLGVFPVAAAGGDEPSLGEYVARAADAEIEQAIGDDPFVLVFGPPRAGKSRTAYEAARRALPDAWVIVPEGAGELKTLVDVDPPLNFGTDTAVLWLDGLDRFTSTLDLDLMDAVGGRAQRLKIVATIREADYEAMLEAGGQEGEVGRRVLTRARGIHLPDKLTAAEEKEAARVLPGRRKGTPLGAGTAEILKGGHAPADPPRGRSTVTLMAPAPVARKGGGWARFVPGALRDDVDRITHLVGVRSDARDQAEARRRKLKERGVKLGTDVNPRRFRPDVVMLVALLVFAFFATRLGIESADHFNERKTAPPTLDQQVLREETRMGEGINPATHALSTRGLDLRSYLISYRPVRRSLSDELRVFDVSGESLGDYVFRFRPFVEEGRGWRFFLRNTKLDIDHDGGIDIVGAYRLSGDVRFVVPVVLYRDKGKKGSGYRIKALVRPASSFAKPVSLFDPNGTTRTVNAGAATDFAIVRMNDTVKLLLGSRTEEARKQGLFSPIHIDAFLLGTERGRPERAVSCIALNRTGGVKSVDFVSRPGPLAPQLVEKWRVYDATAQCGGGI